ncbi:MAG: helix-turn-helix domain-containing protein [Thermoguttaceae bacterium]|nr:helix-turn-helix domain-containing protein [Thermoguttaceae bacterium]
MKCLLDKKQVAAMLGCCQRSVDNLRSTAGLPYHKFGRLVRFDEQEVRSWAGLTPNTNSNDSGEDGNGHKAGKGGRNDFN